MRTRYLGSFIFITAVLLMVSSAWAGHSDRSIQHMWLASVSFPVAQAVAPRYQFDTVIEGTIVKHSFLIKNTGNAMLKIEKVKTSCGCTTAEYTREIQPGSTGKIVIKGNTRGYGGRSFDKTITVDTNDPNNQRLSLYISGNVDRFAVVVPRRVYLSGYTGADIESKISIQPVAKYPFKILSSYAKNLENKVRFTLKKEDNNYVLTVTNITQKTGGYHGTIHLKTDNQVQPEIVLNVSGFIQKKS